MTKAQLKTQALQLPEPERLALAEELWASIENPNAYPESVEIPQWQRDLLDERLAESQEDPGKPWEQVKAEVWPDRR